MSRLKITVKPPESEKRKIVPGQGTKLGSYFADVFTRTEKLIEDRMQTEEFWHEVWSK